MRNQQIERRRERAAKENFEVRNCGENAIFSRFTVERPGGRCYNVQIRCLDDPLNTCTCPDYRTNLLGTCKHIEHVLLHLQQKKKRAFKRALREGPDLAQVALSYRDRIEVTVSRPRRLGGKIGRHVDRYFDGHGVLREPMSRKLPSFLNGLEHLPGQSRRRIQVADEVHEHAAFLAAHADMDARRGAFVQRARTDSSALRLLGTELYPYQLDGVLHLAFTGRAMLADDMGLGKTVQAIAATALLEREHSIERVLVVTPASLKYQWKREIERFSSYSATVVEGPAHKRALLYATPTFFTIVNYELLLRDAYVFEHLKPDLVILDEAQRIKNWRTKTAAAVKSLRSRFAFVLTGTPLENKLDELYSVVQFLDPRLLGPLWRFNQRYFMLEKKRKTFKVLGHKNLDELRERLAPILLRRRKEEVLLDLPERVDNNYFVAMSSLQREPYEDYRTIVARIAAQARHRPLSDREFKRLMMGLQKMRVLSDSLELHDPKISPRQCEQGAPKLAELRSLIGEQVVECGRKAIVFSAFEGMARLVCERVLAPMKIDHVMLSGRVPSRKRGALIDRFTDDEQCRVFVSTDAGSTGLNLQAASLVINVDVPWNPAVLEQRIGRAHRHGQRNPVNVINLVTRHSIEERMLELLDTKRAVFASVLDDVDGVVKELTFDKSRGILKRIDELLGRERQAALNATAENTATTEGTEGSSECIATATPSLETAYQQNLETALIHRLLLLRPLADTPLPKPVDCQAYLVVVEDSTDRDEVEALTVAFNEHHQPTPPFSAHVFDRPGFEGLRSLFGPSLEGEQPALHRAASLPGGTAARDVEEEARTRRMTRARQSLDQSNDRLRLAGVIAQGGFAADALPPLASAMQCALEALAIHHDVGAADGTTVAAPLLQLDLVERTIIDQDLSGRLSQARELISLADQGEATLAEHHLTTIRDTTQQLVERTSALLLADSLGG